MLGSSHIPPRFPISTHFSWRHEHGGRAGSSCWRIVAGLFKSPAPHRTAIRITIRPPPNFLNYGLVHTFPVITFHHQVPFIPLRSSIHSLTLLSSRFKVEDAKYAKDSLAAWACIRLDRLQQGYRFIRLLDYKGLASEGLLLVKIEKTLRYLGEGTPHPNMPAVMPNVTPTMSAPALVGSMGGL